MASMNILPLKVARVSQALRQIDETWREAFRECAQVSRTELLYMYYMYV